MAPQFPSIQSFFPLRPSPRKPACSISPATPPRAGDGFGNADIDAVLHPCSEGRDWIPSREYDAVDINSLNPGPQCVTLVGRIVNFYDQAMPSKMPQAAKGCVKMIIKDDTGALTVRLWYANTTYSLRLGHLVSVWTPHISLGAAGNLAPPTAPLLISIFPERDHSCHFMVHEHSDEGVLCKTPLGYEEDKALDKLVTLKNFVDGAWEVAEVKIMICVRSIGARKKRAVADAFMGTDTVHADHAA